ncbi:3-phenylpropionate permease [Salmonella enterica subsp. enterica]|uniref:3-phenylpropionate permease n=1 Tax=Salmonella enterica I TaxID=59201 RepID=A0A379WP78_SALET|nr:3-phenylpropionate permease [Salmonella enterica subsp. enterica]
MQAVYSAVAMGGSIAIMTVFAGFLYQHLGGGVFWIMALVALPAIFLRPKWLPRHDSRILRICCCWCSVRVRFRMN